MAEKDDRRTPEGSTSVREWVGVVCNADPHDLPAGAAINAMNVASTRPGELRTRGGLTFLRLD